MLVAAILCASTTSLAHAETLQPADWPPWTRLDTAPNAIRYSGFDRYGTAQAVTLGFRSVGEFPFDAPNPSNDAWGAATCPASILVVAGDTPADALAAAAMSDPTNRSDEPRLVRVAAADPSFDPPGAIDRVDTHAAPVIVTTSARSGATSLAPQARRAAVDLARGGCTSAREAIIIGGTGAVSPDVEHELVSIGYEEVFRVAGRDRFDTAARIARALGTEPASRSTCDDARSDDGSTSLGFYGNAVIEYRPTASECRVLAKTVVLADGTVGADALAAGWWTSYWQVPVLLIAGDGSLPPPTMRALHDLDIDSIVVLGGTARIPESTVEEAKAIASAVAGRFAGRDRYETSVAMATVFGGWHPTGDADDFEGDRLCLAGSGTRASAAGWPDALAAGPFCATLAATARRGPARVLEPVARARGPIDPSPPSHAAVPVLLTVAGGTVPESVLDFVAGAFAPDADWCRGGKVDCRTPGFVVAFGGESSIGGAGLRRLSGLVAGDDVAQRGADQVVRAPFRTRLDLSPVFVDGGVGADRTCILRGDVAGVRWLARFSRASELRDAIDLVRTAGYDATGESEPRCMAVTESDPGVLVGVSASGRRTPPVAVGGPAAVAAEMSAPMHHAGPDSTDGDVPSGATTPAVWRFRDAPPNSLVVRTGDDSFDVQEAAATITITRAASGRTRFLAALFLDGGGSDEVDATATGDAVFVDGTWRLAGVARNAAGIGGFAATLRTNATVHGGDDGLTWQLDVFGI